jgi:hypothetical protein
MFREFSFAVAMFLSGTVAHPPMLHNGHPAIGSDAYGASCVITRDYGDSAWAYCQDGTHWYYDADGQLMPNTTGTPMRLPGWQEVK